PHSCLVAGRRCGRGRAVRRATIATTGGTPPWATGVGPARRPLATTRHAGRRARYENRCRTPRPGHTRSQIPPGVGLRVRDGRAVRSDVREGGALGRASRGLLVG